MKTQQSTSNLLYNCNIYNINSYAFVYKNTKQKVTIAFMYANKNVCICVYALNTDPQKKRFWEMHFHKEYSLAKCFRFW
jgi:hypothetical protein